MILLHIELASFSEQLKDLESSLLSSIKEHILKASEASNYSKIALEKELLELHLKQQKELEDLKQELENKRKQQEKVIDEKMNEKRQMLIETLQKEGVSQKTIEQQVSAILN